MKVTYYKLPHRRKEYLDISHVNKEDEIWFQENNVHVSMEEIGGQVACYGDIGKETEDGEPDEIIVLSGSMNCYQTMKKLREECQEALDKS